MLSKRIMYPILAGIVLALVLASCGSDDPADTATPVPPSSESELVGILGSLSLDVPDSALPEGIEASAIRSQVLNVFELSENVERALGDDFVLSVVRLEPEGVEFSEPVTITITVRSENDAQLRVFLVSTQGVEELAGFDTEFDDTRGIIVATGEITHFSDLVVSKPRADETAKEFVERGKAKVARLEAKAEGITFSKERAAFYKEAVDCGFALELEGLARFPGSPDLPRLGGNAYNGARNLNLYAEFMTEDFDFLFANEPDPFAGFTLLQERLELTFEVHKKWLSGAYDERLAPRLGRNDLGETTALVEWGDAITQQIVLDILNEENIDVANELREQLTDIVAYLFTQGASGAFDERVVHGYRTWERLLGSVGINFFGTIGPAPSEDTSDDTTVADPTPTPAPTQTPTPTPTPMPTTTTEGTPILIDMSVRHTAPGSFSEVDVTITAAAGKPVVATLSLAATPTGGALMSGTTDVLGALTLSWIITSFGEYNVAGTVDGISFSCSGTVGEPAGQFASCEVTP
ncbi:MAG: hypothetical protein IH852_06195 [Bacteroidetes bacterium]|nr:hypothetical protein [Bacteroidota bacterium]